MTWITALEVTGTAVFAMSGVFTAQDRKLDWVGTLVVGFVTALGGGTIRDVLIGRMPVAWMQNRSVILAVLLGYVLAYAFNRHIRGYRKSLFLFDTVGIGLFTVLGTQVARDYGLNAEICLLLGVVSAVFGGVTRDVLTGTVPLIFRREIYATACFAGGSVYLSLEAVSDLREVNMAVAMVTVFVIRFFAIRFGWSLGPKPEDASAQEG